MIGIAAISTEIPSQRLDTAPLGLALGMAPETLEQRVGVRRIARKEAQQDTSHLCIAAAQKLLNTGKVTRAQIDCIIVVTQNPDGQGLPQTSAIVHGKLGLPESCAAFDVGLGCSGYVYGLAIAKSFMEANGCRTGLLFTADPYSKIIDETDKRTALLFGDAATVTLLTERPVWQIGKFNFGTQGAKSSAIWRGDDGAGKLAMDGRAVLAFSMQQVPLSLEKAAAANGLSLDQIDRFVLHQGSKVVVQNIGQRLKAEAKTRFYAEQYGNTVSSSIPIVLSQDVPADDRYVAISGFGVGLSWASTVLERVNHQEYLT